MMGWAARVNPHTTVEAKRRARVELTLRGMLAMFADRASYEQWAAARQLTDEQRAHCEHFLPARLQAQGTV